MENLWSSRFGVAMYFIGLLIASALGGLIAGMVIGIWLAVIVFIGIFVAGTVVWFTIRGLGPDTFFEANRDLAGAVGMIAWHVAVIGMIISGIILAIRGGFAAVNPEASQFVENFMTPLTWAKLLLIDFSNTADKQAAAVLIANMGGVMAFLGCYLSFPLDKRTEGMVRAGYVGLFDTLDRLRGNPRPEERIVRLPGNRQGEPQEDVILIPAEGAPAVPYRPLVVADPSATPPVAGVTETAPIPENFNRGGFIRIRLQRDDPRISAFWPGLVNTKFWNEVFIPVGYVVVGLSLVINYVGLGVSASNFAGFAVSQILWGALFYALANRSYYSHKTKLKGENGHASDPRDNTAYDPDAEEKRKEVGVLKRLSLYYVALFALGFGVGSVWDYNRISLNTKTAGQVAVSCARERALVYIANKRAFKPIMDDVADVDGVFDPMPSQGICFTSQGMKTSLCRDGAYNCHPEWQQYTRERADVLMDALVVRMEAREAAQQKAFTARVKAEEAAKLAAKHN